jgi:hypothetical protein
MMQQMGVAADAWRRIISAVDPAVAAIVAGDELRFGSIWEATLLPMRLKLLEAAGAMTNSLASSVHDTGAMGVLANIQQATLPTVARQTDLTFAALRTARCQPAASGPSSPACYVSDAKYGRSDSWQLSVQPTEEAGVQGSISHEWCSMLCAAASADYTHAGLQGTSCFCGSAFPSTAKPAPTANCATPCGGNLTQLCGGAATVTGFTFECTAPARPPPLPARAASWASHKGAAYGGPGRLFVLTPRGRVAPWEGTLAITAVVLTGRSAPHAGGTAAGNSSAPVVSWRWLGSGVVAPGVWRGVPMQRSTPGRLHSRCGHPRPHQVGFWSTTSRLLELWAYHCSGLPEARGTHTPSSYCELIMSRF